MYGWCCNMLEANGAWPLLFDVVEDSAVLLLGVARCGQPWPMNPASDGLKEQRWWCGVVCWGDVLTHHVVICASDVNEEQRGVEFAVVCGSNCLCEK
eukprot:6489592-Amphidinium_carterae.1